MLNRGDKNKKEAKQHPEKDAQHRAKDKPRRRKTNHMTAVLSLVFVGGLFIVAFAFAFHYWQQGSYSPALWWGLAAFIFFAIGVACAMQFYVVGPLEADKMGQHEETPNVIFGKSQLRGPLVPGERPWVQISLTNTTNVPIEGQFTDFTWQVIPAPISQELKYLPKATTDDFQLPARQTQTVHFETLFTPTKEYIDAFNSDKMLFIMYAKGEYWNKADATKRFPLPFCLMYSKDVPGVLALCPQSIKIVENTQPSTPTAKGIPLSVAERPYMAVKLLKLLGPLTAGQHPTIRIIIVNGGKTPASDVLSYIRVITTDTSISEAIRTFPVKPTDKGEGRSYLTAGMERVVDFPQTSLVMTPQHLQFIKAGLLHLYVVGEIHYRDIQGSEYTTQIRAVYDPADGGFIDAQ
jgi:hypothetical protein